MVRFSFTVTIAWIFCLSFCSVVFAETTTPEPAAVAQNSEFEQLKRQGEGGNAAAQYALGVAYTMGKGVGQNYFTGIRWFRKAAAQGHVEALMRLGIAYADNIHFKPDYALAMDCFRRAAEQGHPSAQYFLGDSYNLRSRLKEDKVEAFKWYQKAAEQGNPQGQLRLGLMYDRGLGVETNHIEALKLWRKAAEQGLPVAQRILGHAYWRGKVETNAVEACAWLKISIAGMPLGLESEARASNELDGIQRSMTPQQLEQVEKRVAQLRAQIRPSQTPTYGNALENRLFLD